jgi:ABC-type nitrate/sulfonate/bicarbonate transport system substrate-binding protein
MNPNFGRRAALRRGLYVAGGLVVVGPAAGLLSACGGDDDDDTAGTTGATGATTGTTPGTTAGTSAATTGASTSGALVPVSYQLSWLPTVEHCGTYIAIEEGIFAAKGLTVTPIPGGPNKQTVATVVSGQAMIGGDGADNIGAGRAEGAPVKIFGARLQKNPLCVMSLAATPITTPDELIGTTIGVAQGNQTPWDVFLKVVGLDASEINVVPVQFDPAPTANGEVQGQVVFAINEPAQLQVQGIETNTLLFADFGFSIFAGCYFATEDTIKNNKDALVKFLEGERAGFEQNLADPALGTKYTLEIYGKDLGLDPGQQQAQSELLASVMVTPNTEANGLLSLSPDDIAANIETLGIAGVDIDADLFTTEILEAMS